MNPIVNNPVVFGDSYGDLARNEQSGQALDDSYYFNTLADQARKRDAAFQSARFASDANYRRWLAQQDNAYRTAALAQSGAQFGQNLDFEKARNAGDLDYRNRALTQSGSQFGQNLDFEKMRNAANVDYQNRALAQSGSQFGQNLDLQRNAQALDNAYKYNALNMNASESAANRAAHANESAATNDLGWAHLSNQSANEAANLDFANRQLAQTGDIQRAGLDQAKTNSDLQWQHSLDLQDRQDAKVLQSQKDALYKEAYTNIANGVIRTPDQLNNWEGGRLSSDQFNNLNSLLEQANRASGLSYGHSQQRADALNFQLEKLKPTGYDAATQALATAPTENAWYHPWGKTPHEIAAGALPLSMFEQNKEKFLETIGKSKAYGDVIFDPVSGHFVPSSPVPEGYVPTVPVTPSPSNPVTPAPGNTQASVPTGFVPVPGTNYVMDPSARSTMIAQMQQYTNPFDKEAVRNAYIKSALDSGTARMVSDTSGRDIASVASSGNWGDIGNNWWEY